jgi:hypothetical protein
LVFLGVTKTDDALAKVTAALDHNQHANVYLLSAMAWLQLIKGKVEESKRWLVRALEVNPRDVKSTQLMWEVCGEQKDYVCLIEYRKRLGLPTHFNQEQYRDVSKAWQEQARKNGVGLAAREPDSTIAAKPPKVAATVIIPLGARVPPELAGLDKILAEQLQGIKVSLGALEELPEGAYKIDRDQVIWEAARAAPRHRGTAPRMVSRSREGRVGFAGRREEEVRQREHRRRTGSLQHQGQPVQVGCVDQLPLQGRVRPVRGHAQKV